MNGFGGELPQGVLEGGADPLAPCDGTVIRDVLGSFFYLVLPCLAAIWARGMHARRRDGADGRSVFFPLLVISEQWNIRVFWVLGTFWMQFLEGFWKISG